MVQFDPVSYSVTEGGQASLIAVLNFEASYEVMVDFATDDGSARGDLYSNGKYSIYSGHLGTEGWPHFGSQVL